MKTSIKQKMAGIAALVLIFLTSASQMKAQVNAYKVYNYLNCSVDISWTFYNGASCASGTQFIAANSDVTILSNICPTNLTDVDITVTDVNGTTVAPITVNFGTQSTTGLGAGTCAAVTMQWFGAKTIIY